MPVSRRILLKGLCSLPALSLPLHAEWAVGAAPRLPDKESFAFDGVYLDAAYTHPLSLSARAGYTEFLKHRAENDTRIGPGNNARRAAVESFARLIHAKPEEVAVVPSTMEGENLVCSALALNEKTAVITDELHYPASLVLYGELAKRGVPLKVVAPRDGIIPLDDVDAALGNNTRLVAVSLVSSISGFQYDLKALCNLAHSKGALVYADIIQAAGAVPIDVKASGVDFCACGTYKWLMGDFGTAFLYVRPDRLAELKRVQVGWRQVREESPDVFPAAQPHEWTLGSDAPSMFEVSTPAWGALACVAQSLAYIHSLGVEAIVQHRKAFIDRLRQELPKLGFHALTPPESITPVLAFSYKGAAARFAKALREANIWVSTYENRIRISPSVYNDLEDAEKLLRVLAANAG